MNAETLIASNDPESPGGQPAGPGLGEAVASARAVGDFGWEVSTGQERGHDPSRLLARLTPMIQLVPGDDEGGSDGDVEAGDLPEAGTTETDADTPESGGLPRASSPPPGQHHLAHGEATAPEARGTGPASSPEGGEAGAEESAEATGVVGPEGAPDADGPIVAARWQRPLAAASILAGAVGFATLHRWGRSRRDSRSQGGMRREAAREGGHARRPRDEEGRGAAATGAADDDPRGGMTASQEAARAMEAQDPTTAIRPREPGDFGEVTTAIRPVVPGPVGGTAR